MKLRYENGEWLIDGEIWPADFASAIFPVEYQEILARMVRHKAFFLGKKSEALEREAEKMEKAARIDALCELKWKAREAEHGPGIY